MQALTRLCFLLRLRSVPRPSHFGTDPTPPGQIIDQNSALRLFLRRLRHDESLKERGAGKVELVARRIVHGRSLYEIVVLNEG